MLKLIYWYWTKAAKWKTSHACPESSFAGANDQKWLQLNFKVTVEFESISKFDVRSVGQNQFRLYIQTMKLYSLLKTSPLHLPQ